MKYKYFIDESPAAEKQPEEETKKSSRRSSKSSSRKQSRSGTPVVVVENSADSPRVEATSENHEEESRTNERAPTPIIKQALSSPRRSIAIALETKITENEVLKDSNGGGLLLPNRRTSLLNLSASKLAAVAADGRRASEVNKTNVA